MEMDYTRTESDWIDTELNERVRSAAMDNDLTGLQAALLAGGNPNPACDEANPSATDYAVMRGNLAALKLLLEAGADPTEQGYDGCLLIEKAAYGGHPEIVEYLIDKWKLPADYAEIYQQYDRHERSHPLRHSTPLADVSSDPREWYLPEDKPGIQKYLDCARILIARGCNVNFTHELLFMRTPLHSAVNWSAELTELLLEHGADANAIDANGETPLSEAAKAGRPDIIKLLLGARVKPKPGIRNKYGESSLHHAAAAGCMQSIRILLEMGEPLDAKSKTEATPLHSAAEHGKTDIARYLLSCRLGVNDATSQKWTPLLFASLGNHIETARLLIESGADVLATAELGFTALHLTAKFQHPWRQWYDDRKPECMDDWASSAPLMDLLLKNGADIGGLASELALPFMFPTINNVVGESLQEEILYEIDGDPSLKAQQYSPLQCCFNWEMSQLDCAELLLARGADLNIVDKHGNTLMHTMLLPGFQNLKSAEWLLTHGINGNIPDSKGKTGTECLYALLGKEKGYKFLEKCGRLDLTLMQCM